MRKLLLRLLDHDELRLLRSRLWGQRNLRRLVWGSKWQYRRRPRMLLKWRRWILAVDHHPWWCLGLLADDLDRLATTHKLLVVLLLLMGHWLQLDSLRELRRHWWWWWWEWLVLRRGLLLADELNLLLLLRRHWMLWW